MMDEDEDDEYWSGRSRPKANIFGDDNEVRSIPVGHTYTHTRNRRVGREKKKNQAYPAIHYAFMLSRSITFTGGTAPLTKN